MTTLIGDDEFVIEVLLRFIQADKLTVRFVQATHVRNHALNLALLLRIAQRQTFDSESVMRGKALERRIQHRLIATRDERKAFGIVRGQARGDAA